MRLPKKLKTLIKENKDYITSNCVCYCYFNTSKVNQISIDLLNEEALDERYYESEWWIEDGDLCLMKGRR